MTAKTTTDGISPNAFEDAGGTEDWRVIGDGGTTFVPTGSLAESARLVAAIADLEGIADHPPDVDIRADGVTVRLLTYADDYYGMSQRDVEAARQISAAARGLGLEPDPSVVHSLLVIPGTPTAISEIVPFWRALLGYEPRRDSPEEDLVDPGNRLPGFWFEHMNEARGDGGGAIHIAIWLPFEQAEARVQAALAAGGRMVRDEHAPNWWTLADAAGNEADISTVRHRD
ncbi:MAG TPA: VOC family protein [Candidatus Limnocylindrales bacterium]|nr:VOC family protein [Candidatus Limnocylindrales bacterium]